MEEKYISFMNKCISSLVWDAVRIAWRYPAYLTSFFRLALYQSGAEKLRSKHAEQGIPVPAFMIISITRRCNLTCRGCYSHATLEREKKEGRGTELDSQNLKTYCPLKGLPWSFFYAHCRWRAIGTC
jgi:hypothetical protein